MEDELKIITRKAFDRLIELLDIKNPNKKELDAIKVLSDIVINTNFHFRMNNHS